MTASKDIIATRLGNVKIAESPEHVEMNRSNPSNVYSDDIELGLVGDDPPTGGEHYLVRYRAGLQAKVHRHSAAHTIVVLEGSLVANNRVVGSGTYCYFPASEPLFHAPAGDHGCTFLILFHGPFDIEVLSDDYFSGFEMAGGTAAHGAG